MKKILVATTNAGKLAEITSEYADLPFKFVSLKDVGLNKIEIEEPHDHTWQNALDKAKFFANKTKLPTIAEDTGLFINYLKGQPGIKTKRYGATSWERNSRVLENLKNVPIAKRQARFATSLCFFDPVNENFSIFSGQCLGVIAKKMSGQPNEGMGYDTIFYYPPAKKLFSQMSVTEKNLVSHRGQALTKLRYFLARQYTPKQIICSIALIVKDRKLLLLKRRDPRPNFNNKWEFPGGGVEYGETPESSLKRETKEETGLAIDIVERISKVFTISVPENEGHYQVFLILFICKIKSGKFKISDTESAGHGWYTYKEILKLDLLPLNKKFIKENKKIICKFID